jgi:hypothetical protein
MAIFKKQFCKPLLLLLFTQFFLYLFRFVSKQFCLFRLFRYGSETPKRTETNRKNNLLVSRNKPKMNRNRLSFGLFRFEPKNIFVCFEDTLVLTDNIAKPQHFDATLGSQMMPLFLGLHTRTVP